MTKASIPWNTRQITKAIENQSFRFDNAIQRGEVWDVKRKSLLIDSLLRGYPVPPMFAIRTGDTVTTKKGVVSVYDCIDGKQRCTTISKFKNNEFYLMGVGSITDDDGDEIDLEGLTYEQLPQTLKDEFDSATLNVIYFSDVTDDEISEMMSRLNNGKPLTNVENARIKARDLEGIMELGQHDLFGEYLTEAAIKGYNNEDIVIKTYIQLTQPDDPCFDAKNTRTIYTGVEFTDEVKARLNGVLDKAREVISEIENNAPKKIFRKTIRKANMLAIISLMELEMSAEDIAVKVTEFFSPEDGGLSVSEEYNEASTNGTNHSAQVKTRNEQIRLFVQN